MLCVSPLNELPKHNSIFGCAHFKHEFMILKNAYIIPEQKASIFIPDLEHFNSLRLNFFTY